MRLPFRGRDVEEECRHSSEIAELAAYTKASGGDILAALALAQSGWLPEQLHKAQLEIAAMLPPDAQLALINESLETPEDVRNLRASLRERLGRAAVLELILAVGIEQGQVNLDAIPADYEVEFGLYRRDRSIVPRPEDLTLREVPLLNIPATSRGNGKFELSSDLYVYPNPRIEAHEIVRFAGHDRDLPGHFGNVARYGKPLGVYIQPQEAYHTLIHASYQANPDVRGVNLFLGSVSINDRHVFEH